jgi:hypothetical protein
LCGRQRRAEDRKFLKCEEGFLRRRLNRTQTLDSDRSLTCTHTQSSRDDEAKPVIVGLSFPTKLRRRRRELKQTTTLSILIIDQIRAGRIPHPSGWTPTATPIRRRRRKVRQPTFHSISTQFDSVESILVFSAADAGGDGDKALAFDAPQPPQPLREDYVQNAVKFLSHPKVRGSAVVYRRSFLQNKGLTSDEIDEAFRRVPVLLRPAPLLDFASLST